MKKKLISLIAGAALALAMVPAAAFAGVTDDVSGNIERRTQTLYHTTLVVEVCAGSLDGALLYSQTSEKMDGTIASTEVEHSPEVLAKKNEMAAAAQTAIGAQCFAVTDSAEGLSDVYYEVHDEITNMREDEQSLLQSIEFSDQEKVIITTILDRYETYKVTYAVEPHILPVFDSPQDVVSGVGMFQGATYVGEDPDTQEFVPVEGSAMYTVNGSSYSETGLRDLLAALSAGTQVEASFEFQGSGNNSWFTDEGSIVFNIVGASKAHKIIEGDGSTHKLGTDTGLAFRSDAELDLFNYVMVDNRTLDADCYTVSEGPTLVSLSADFLNTLAVGEHTVAIVSGEGPDAAAATASFSILAADQAGPASDQAGDAAKESTQSAALPATGDSALPGACAVACAVAAFCLVLSMRARRRMRG